jgi:hypothetical protein
MRAGHDGECPRRCPVKLLLEASLESERDRLVDAGHEVDVLDAGRQLNDAIGEASWHGAVLVTSDPAAEREYTRTPWLTSAVYAPAGTERRIPGALNTLARMLASRAPGTTALVVLEPEREGTTH